MYNWIAKIGYDNVLNLLGDLSTVKDATITWNSNMYSEREYTDRESDMTIFYSLLHAIKGGDKVYCGGQFSDVLEEKNPFIVL